MRRLNTKEWGILILAVLSLLVGSEMVFHPTEILVFHQNLQRSRDLFERLSKERAAIYGVLAILMGVALIWTVFYGRRK